MMRRPPYGFVLYFIASIIIFVIWSLTHKGEREGEDSTPGFTSIVLAARGEAGTPFVFRRLLPDTARLTARVIPASVWDGVRDLLGSKNSLIRGLRATLDNYLQWKPDDYPILISAHFLIWASILGFIYAARALAGSFYAIEPGFSWWIGLLFGFGLLGSLGERWYVYSYDLPNVCLFTVALWAIASGRDRLFWPVYVLVVYSKETSLLLIFAWALAHANQWRGMGYWLRLAALAAIYLSIRLWIAHQYADAPQGRFWFPDRNASELANSAYRLSWLWAILVVVIVQMVRIRKRMPPLLLRWLLLIPVLVLPALFKGWVEERRQYLELYPIIGLLVLQWATEALGRPDLMRPKVASADDFGPGNLVGSAGGIAGDVSSAIPWINCTTGSSLSDLRRV